MKTRVILYLAQLVLTTAMLVGFVVDALAQSYPNKSIRLIVAYPPGGGVDIIARVIGQKLTEKWRQTVIVDNRPGSAGLIGTEIAAKARPDGYTLLMGQTGTLTINPSLYSKCPYDPIKDFAPITLTAVMPFILVIHPSVPVTTVKELIAFAKSKPGTLNFASSGSGSVQHLGGELFKTMTGVDMVHIPYKGGAPAFIDLLGGRVSLIFSTMPPALPHVKAGKIRALAMAGTTRSPLFPDLPTIAESGVPGYDVSSWNGVVAPAGTPKEIINLLNTEIAKILRQPDVNERLSSEGSDPVSSTPEQFGAMIKADVAKWAKVIKACGAQAD